MDLVMEVEAKLPRPSWEGYQGDVLSIIEGELKNISNSASLGGFKNLCNRPWFRRGWVIQEVFLPVREETIGGDRRSLILEKKTVVCGKRAVNWRLFSKIKLAVAPENGMHLSRDPLMVVQPKLDPPSFQRVPMPIRNLVYEFRDQNMTDPRDRIYGFFGLATDLEEEEKNHLTDYESSVATIYTRFAKLLLIRNQPRDLPLKLLSLCYRIPAPTEEEQQEFDERREMPSWVPDWTLRGTKKSPHRPRMVFEDILDVGCSFNATLRTFVPKHAEVSEDNKILTVESFQVDSMTQVGAVYGMEEVEPGQLEFLREFSPMTPYLITTLEKSRALHLSWEKIIDHLPVEYRRTRETRDEAYWKTLCADRDQNKPAGSSMRDSFRAWRELSRLGPHKRHVPNNVPLLWQKSLLFAGAHRRAIFKQASLRNRGRMMGITSVDVQEGNLVFLILGTNVPFILRKNENENGPQLVGEAYCHGLMNGEGMRDPKEEIRDLPIV